MPSAVYMQEVMEYRYGCWGIRQYRVGWGEKENQLHLKLGKRKFRKKWDALGYLKRDSKSCPNYQLYLGDLGTQEDNRKVEDLGIKMVCVHDIEMMFSSSPVPWTCEVGKFVEFYLKI